MIIYWLTNLATMITLILFIFYFAGRIWTICIDSKYRQVNISIDNTKDIQQYPYFDIDCHGREVIILKFDTNIKYLKLVMVEEETIDKFREIEKVKELKYIPSGTPITICTDIPECIPNQKVIFQCSDGIKGDFLLDYAARGDNGGIAKKDYHIHKSFKAWLYYLLR